MTIVELNDEEDSAMVSEYEARAHERRPSVGNDNKLPVFVRFVSFVLGAAVLLPWNGVFNR